MVSNNRTITRTERNELLSGSDLMFSSEPADQRPDNTNKSQKDDAFGRRQEVLVNPDSESRGGKSLRTTQVRGRGGRKGSREMKKREGYQKLHHHRANLQNQSPGAGLDQSCGFSSLISLNNNSYYNQSSDPPAVTGMMAPAPAQPQPLLEPGLRSSLADDVIRPKPDEAVSPGHRHIDSRQAIHPIDRRSAGESSSSSPSSERERR